MIRHLTTTICCWLFVSLVWTSCVWADGKVVRPRDYHGSLEELAQEAIIIFQPGTEQQSAVEDLILKISVTGATNQFAWVIPLPKVPETTVESPALFQELFNYCELKSRSTSPKTAMPGTDAKSEAPKVAEIKVIKTEVAGSFLIETVRPIGNIGVAQALNRWLVEQGYQPLEQADDVLNFYQRKNYVFACIRVNDAALRGDVPVEITPLRLRFNTGGRDGIIFPMKLTGLQAANFNVNLYVFARSWINNNLNQFGYEQQGFRLNFRDYDSSTCIANSGKWFANPTADQYLKPLAESIPNVTRLMQRLYPEGRFYLTKLSAYQLNPIDVRHWADDLWLFPYYTNTAFVPYDVRAAGPAAIAWPGQFRADTDYNYYGPMTWFIIVGCLMFVVMLVTWIIFRRRRINVSPWVE
jgi:hypothetical protein